MYRVSIRWVHEYFVLLRVPAKYGHRDVSREPNARAKKICFFWSDIHKKDILKCLWNVYITQKWTPRQTSGLTNELFLRASPAKEVGSTSRAKKLGFWVAVGPKIHPKPLIRTFSETIAPSHFSQKWRGECADLENPPAQAGRKHC